VDDGEARARLEALIAHLDCEIRELGAGHDTRLARAIDGLISVRAELVAALASIPRPDLSK